MDGKFAPILLEFADTSKIVAVNSQYNRKATVLNTTSINIDQMFVITTSSSLLTVNYNYMV